MTDIANWLRERKRTWMEAIEAMEAGANEIERLRAELEKAHRLIGQSIGWQRDAEIAKAKKDVEIERLQAELIDAKGNVREPDL